MINMNDLSAKKSFSSNLSSNQHSSSTSNTTVLNNDQNSISIESNLIELLKQNNPKNFRLLLASSYNFISPQSKEKIFKEAINIYKSGTIYGARFITILLSFGVNPNILIYQDQNFSEEFEKNETLLMFVCQQSNISLVSSLCESKIPLDVNKLDAKGRNALFYLKGGSEDKKIIELLLQKNIDINCKDIFGNTALHNAILLKNVKENLIYDLIDVANMNLFIKNKDEQNCLDLLAKKWENKVNNNFNDMQKIVNLIKNKLSFQKGKIFNENNNNDNENQEKIISNKNLIKFNPENENDIFIQMKPIRSLIINNQFKDNITNMTTNQKIEYYEKLNRNKKYFLNILKTTEFKLNDKLRPLIEEINLKKSKLMGLEKELLSKKNQLEINKNNEFCKVQNDLNIIENKIKSIKQKILSMNNQNNQNINPNIIEIPYNNNFIYKFNSPILRDDLNNELNYEYIYSQLKIDLLDYTAYVHNKNSKLESIIHELKNLIKNTVKICLSDEYEVKVYGSRETGVCLPWSDIDFVIICKDIGYFEPLSKIYEYLKINYKNFEIKYISTTQIPIIKINTGQNYKNISLDVSIELPEHHGGECVQFIKNKLKEFEVLSPITFALKTIFQKAKINDPYTGGLSSYGIILMIINFLQKQQKNGIDISMNNLGKLFYELLYFYGSEYNVNEPINVNNIDISKIMNYFNDNEGKLYIIDPLNPLNNVAKNTRQLANIKMALMLAHYCVLESCECGCHSQHSVCIKEESCEHNLLSRIFNAVKRQ